MCVLIAPTVCVDGFDHILHTVHLPDPFQGPCV